MLLRGKLTMSQFFSNPGNVRAVLIISSLIIAALAGAAPNDHGGM